MTNDKRSPTNRRSLLIFYTLRGPTAKLEIYDEKIRLIKKTWVKLLTKKEVVDTWYIRDLSEFEISIPKFLFFSGKIEWTTFSGEKGAFRFTTNALMTKKIEAYLQKRVLKNYQALERGSRGELPYHDQSTQVAA
jgi:hypothetical protein